MIEIDKEAWIETFTGRRFYPLNPSYAEVDINDIAHSLSMKCRFNGHCREFYSVAEHSVRVLDAALDGLGTLGYSPVAQLIIFLHDSAEAYLPDICRPIKKAFRNFEQIETNVLNSVFEAFQLPSVEHVIGDEDVKPDCDYSPLIAEAVKRCRKYDDILLATESRDLNMNKRQDWGLTSNPLKRRIIPMTFKEAESAFLDRFWKLTNERERLSIDKHA